jgi:transposase InsO family protein
MAMARDRRVPNRPGRPGHGEATRDRVARLVAEQRTIQGRRAGWRPISKALPGVPVRLIQAALSAQKRAERTLERRRRQEARVTREVLARDAIWGEDATGVGRTGGEPILCEVIRDLATTSTVALSAGAPASAADVIGLLEQARRDRGTLPLVWQTDNGPAYASAELSAYLERHRVVHLRSRPRTPTDNPSTERGIGELKAESGLEAGLPLRDRAEASARLEAARATLDRGRRRASRGYRTAAALDVELPRAQNLVGRDAFYAQARSPMGAALLGARTARAARAAQREALWRVLERCGLARRSSPASRPAATRGDPLRTIPHDGRMPT